MLPMPLSVIRRRATVSATITDLRAFRLNC